MRGNPFEKGNLFIKFSVKFPSREWALNAKLSQLENLLPKRQIPKAVAYDDDCEEVHIEDPEVPRNRRQGGQGYHGGMEYDDDEGHGPHGQGVQCQQS